eukprot:c9776_g1_i1 orf=1-270(-)
MKRKCRDGALSDVCLKTKEENTELHSPSIGPALYKYHSSELSLHRPFRLRATHFCGRKEREKLRLVPTLEVSRDPENNIVSFCRRGTAYL